MISRTPSKTDPLMNVEQNNTQNDDQNPIKKDENLIPASVAIETLRALHELRHNCSNLPPEASQQLEQIVDDLELHLKDVVCHRCLTSKGGHWIGCDRCSYWFHRDCVLIPMDFNDSHPWFCNKCENKKEVEIADVSLSSLQNPFISCNTAKDSNTEKYFFSSDQMHIEPPKRGWDSNPEENLPQQDSTNNTPRRFLNINPNTTAIVFCDSQLKFVNSLGLDDSGTTQIFSISGGYIRDTINAVSEAANRYPNEFRSRIKHVITLTGGNDLKVDTVEHAVKKIDELVVILSKCFEKANVHVFPFLSRKDTPRSVVQAANDKLWNNQVSRILPLGIMANSKANFFKADLVHLNYRGILSICNVIRRVVGGKRNQQGPSLINFRNSKQSYQTSEYDQKSSFTRGQQVHYGSPPNRYVQNQQRFPSNRWNQSQQRRNMNNHQTQKPPYRQHYGQNPRSSGQPKANYSSRQHVPSQQQEVTQTQHPVQQQTTIFIPQQDSVVNQTQSGSNLHPSLNPITDHPELERTQQQQSYAELYPSPQQLPMMLPAYSTAPIYHQDQGFWMPQSSQQQPIQDQLNQPVGNMPLKDLIFAVREALKPPV